jgi:hypothetical protein
MSRAAVSVRLDERALEALAFLEASGLRRSDAIREALVEKAHRTRDAQLREAAAAIAADPAERRLAAQVLAQMEELAGPG